MNSEIEKLSSLSFRELQSLAKSSGVKANQKADKLAKQLAELRVLSPTKSNRENISGNLKEAFDALSISGTPNCATMTLNAGCTPRATREELSKMKYNQLRSFAKSVGTPAKGKAVDLIEAILSTQVEDEDNAVPELTFITPSKLPGPEVFVTPAPYTVSNKSVEEGNLDMQKQEISTFTSAREGILKAPETFNFANHADAENISDIAAVDTCTAICSFEQDLPVKTECESAAKCSIEDSGDFSPKNTVETISKEISLLHVNEVLDALSNKCSETKLASENQLEVSVDFDSITDESVFESSNTVETNIGFDVDSALSISSDSSFHNKHCTAMQEHSLSNSAQVDNLALNEISFDSLYGDICEPLEPDLDIIGVSRDFKNQLMISVNDTECSVISQVLSEQSTDKKVEHDLQGTGERCSRFLLDFNFDNRNSFEEMTISIEDSQKENSVCGGDTENKIESFSNLIASLIDFNDIPPKSPESMGLVDSVISMEAVSNSTESTAENSKSYFGISFCELSLHSGDIKPIKKSPISVPGISLTDTFNELDTSKFIELSTSSTIDSSAIASSSSTQLKNEVSQETGSTNATNIFTDETFSDKIEFLNSLDSKNVSIIDSSKISENQENISIVKNQQNSDEIELKQLVDTIPYLSWAYNGERVRCNLTGHEIVSKLSDVVLYLSSKKMRHIVARYEAQKENSTMAINSNETDEIQKLKGVPTPKGTKKVFSDESYPKTAEKNQLAQRIKWV